ncbi:MAG: hypothetical protein K6T51_10610 [Rubrobacteraceae bacterium]|uniref:hypothetical protein n=1 Tax=Rubrobacter naiadicus TaxID=1392641 RepID=UPI002361D525|nr:hypothetical protein [Rubrobacter naiadicus]MBX6763183.1 hypothetical protein [Rubrobacteraceae bacterium]MCL6439053.1 hypothetical protein [Rubrobacteraceae bacterium]
MRRIAALGAVQEELEALAREVRDFGPEYARLAERLLEDAAMAEVGMCREEAAMPQPLTYEDFIADTKP